MRQIFLDTETTGLSGGTGTLAFLVGVAYFEDDELVVEQLARAEARRAVVGGRRLAMRAAHRRAVHHDAPGHAHQLFRIRVVRKIHVAKLGDVRAGNGHPLLQSTFFPDQSQQIDHRAFQAVGLKVA